MYQQFVSSVPILDDVDVIVCGGGPAGIGAAIAAARQGARTLLLESQGCLGGVATNTLVGVWLGSYSRDGAYPVIGGIFTEIVDRMLAEDSAIPASKTGSGSRFMGYASWHVAPVPFEFEACKRICEQIVLEANVTLRYFTTFVAPKLEDGHINGVYVHSKDGLAFIPTKVIVDATGDADVTDRAGCPTIKGRAEDGLLSPASLIFVVEGVEYQAFENYCRTTGDVRLRKIVQDLRQKDVWPFPFEIIIALEMIHRGRYLINTLRQTGIDGTRTEDLTQGMIEGRQEAHQLFKLMQQFVPGFANARLIQTSPVIGIRETRRIVGDYQVTKEDIIQSRHFDDVVALSGYQWDMADPKRPSVQRMEGTKTALPFAEIPYRCLLPQNVDNLIVVGRSISTDWDALGPLRIMPACFAMGQAAGTAAAMALQQENNFRKIDVRSLQANLINQGAILEP